jgi:hypothetical protein
MGLAHWEDAVSDLQQAQRMCESLDPQADLIDEKLEEARRRAQDAKASPPHQTAEPSADPQNSGDITIEDVTQQATAAAPHSRAQGAATDISSSNHSAEVSDGGFDATKKMLEDMENMSDDEFRRMAVISGMPHLDRSMAKQVCSHTMSEQLKIHHYL